MQTYNMLRNCEFLDYVCVIPQVYTFYSPSLQANTTYDINVTTFKNSCIGLAPYVKAENGNNNDCFSNTSFSYIQLKNQDGNEITNNFNDTLLKAINTTKMKNSSLLISGLNFLFFANDIWKCLQNNYIDGAMSFNGEDKKICVQFSSAKNNIYVVFLKIVL